MKKQTAYLWFLLVLLPCCIVQAQNPVIDSLKQQLLSTNDTLRMAIYQRLSDEFNTFNMDSALSYAEKYIAVSQKLNYRLNEAEGLILTAFNAEQSSASQMDLILRAQKILDENTDKRMLPSRFLTIMRIPPHLHNYKSYSLYLEYRIVSGFSYVYWANSKFSKAFPYAVRSFEIANKLDVPQLTLPWSF